MLLTRHGKENAPPHRSAKGFPRLLLASLRGGSHEGVGRRFRDRCALNRTVDERRCNKQQPHTNPEGCESRGPDTQAGDGPDCQVGCHPKGDGPTNHCGEERPAAQDTTETFAVIPNSEEPYGNCCRKAPHGGCDRDFTGNSEERRVEHRASL